jgi:hypothetical protein
MKSLARLALIVVVAVGPGLRAADDYAPGSDSKPQAGVPKGEQITFELNGSKIYPG